MVHAHVVSCSGSVSEEGARSIRAEGDILRSKQHIFLIEGTIV